MSETGVAHAYRLLAAGLDALEEASGPTATDEELFATLTGSESLTRRCDRLVVGVVAELQRRGSFAARGYRNTTTALADLVGWDRADAHRRVIAAEQAHPRIGLDGTPLPAHLPRTAAVFTACGASLRHIDVIPRLLAGPAARRLSPDVWAGAEAQLAATATDYTPTELLDWGTRLIDTLDQDGPAPDDEPEPVNELHLTRHRGRPGGTLKGHYDDAGMFAAVAAAVDARAPLVDADESRTPAQRQAEALADVCGYVLDHGDLPQCGGARPQLNVHVSLADLENRARAACLDFGGVTALDNLVLLCRACHRLVHHAGWAVKLVDGIPEFYPPTWADPQRRPRRRPPPQPTAA